MQSPSWLRRAQRLAAISQNGLTFTKDPFERARWEEVRQLAAEMLADGAGASIDQALAMLAAETGYATPKVDVRAAVFQGDEILLVQERSDGRWTLPGGWCDVGEAPGVAAAREITELLIGELDARHELDADERLLASVGSRRRLHGTAS